MLAQLGQIYNKYASLIEPIGFIVSVLTFITMLRFRKRIRIEFERQNFTGKKRKILREIDGYRGSLQDDKLYTEDFLNKVNLQVNEISTAYTFLPVRTKFLVKYTELIIEHSCINEVKQNKDEHRYKLCKLLQDIYILLEKEF